MTCITQSSHKVIMVTHPIKRTIIYLSHLQAISYPISSIDSVILLIYWVIVFIVYRFVFICNCFSMSVCGYVHMSAVRAIARKGHHISLELGLHSVVSYLNATVGKCRCSRRVRSACNCWDISLSATESLSMWLTHDLP